MPLTGELKGMVQLLGLAHLDSLQLQFQHACGGLAVRDMGLCRQTGVDEDRRARGFGNALLEQLKSFAGDIIGHAP